MDENMELDLEQEEEEVDLLTLIAEDGTELEFEIADTAEFEGVRYMALIPVLNQAEEILEDSGELVILRVSEGEGEEFLESIEDEDEFNRVGDFFMKRLEDTFDFED
ncbi:DUF1292 domain-containing protein [Oscillospiraceae bacterium MB08-C2-2]|nr:DUF1292 domain-containing protein [Oscillospiraceae bacterium MB08-C2-2]